MLANKLWMPHGHFRNDDSNATPKEVSSEMENMSDGSFDISRERRL